MKRVSALLAVASIALLSSPAAAGAADRLDVYVGEVPKDQLTNIVDLGVDRHELKLSASARGRVRVETIMSARQAAELRRDGVVMTPKKVDGQTVAQRATALAAEGFEVFRTYSGAGGLKAEFEQTARANRKHRRARRPSARRSTARTSSRQGDQERAQRGDGKRPTALYLGAQHAREWITPEMVRRLLDHFLDNYGSDPDDHRAGRTRTSCGSCPSPTPTATTSRSQTSRTGCGARTCATTMATASSRRATASTSTATSRPVGLRQRGLVARPCERDLPRRRPGVGAGDAGADRLFKRSVGRSSSSTTTRRPSCCCTASAGRSRRRRPTTSSTRRWPATTRDPAVPGYDPDICRRAVHGQRRHRHAHAGGVTARSASRPRCRRARPRPTSTPTTSGRPRTAGAGSSSPTTRPDPGRVREEHPVRPRRRRVGRRPGRPGVGGRARHAETSGSTRSTSPTATRRPWPSSPSGPCATCELNYRINGGQARTPPAREWSGGERYGFENDDYYAEYRGDVQRRRRAATGGGVVHGEERGQAGEAARAGRERALHLHGAERHRRRRAGHR